MKNILKYALLTFIGAASFITASNAQTPKPEDVIKLSKEIIPVEPEAGKYKIRLETFVTGSSVTHTEYVGKPVDLVLVLDVSSSMTSNHVGGSYNMLESADYSYGSFGEKTLYYYDEGTSNYYEVHQGTEEIETGNKTVQYGLYYIDKKGVTQYLGTWQDTSNGIIYSGELLNSNFKKVQVSIKYDGYNNDYYIKANGENCQIIKTTREVKETAKLLYVDINNTRYYLSGTGLTTTQPTNVTTVDAVIWTGVLYSRGSGVTRLEALKEAVNAFIDTVAENSKGADKTPGTEDDVENRISIVSFGRHEKYVTGTTDPAMHNTIDLDRDTEDGGTGNVYGNNFISVSGTAAAANVTTLKNHVTNLSTLSGTRQDRGLLGAMNNLDAIDATRFAESSKVIVVFTDGEPYANQETNIDDDGIDNGNEVPGAAAGYSYTLKNGTRTDGLKYDAKVFTVSIGLTPGSNYDKFMRYISSNYPDVTDITTGYVPLPTGVQPLDGANYSFSNENGDNLTQIFTAIAKESSQGGESYPLDANSTTLIDVVSNNFVIPSSVTANNVNVWVEELYDVDLAGDGKTILEYHWANSSDTEHYHYTGSIPTPVIKHPDDPVTEGEYKNSLSISGFDFAMKDTPSIPGDENSAPVEYSGNWVGPRTYDVNGVPVTKYWGRRLVIEFPIEVNPNYEGGYAMPSNDIASGLYINGTKILEYPVPTVDFPSICIMKDGLKVGESALFDVTGPNNLHYTVTLTNDGKKPCYVILKRLNGGTYTVTEKSWSWLYSTTPSSKTMTQEVIGADALGIKVEDFVGEGSTAEDLILHMPNSTGAINETAVGRRLEFSTTIGESQSYSGTFCVLKDKNGEYTVSDLKGSAISLLYYFTNTRDTAGKPARAESYAHNEFQGGKTQGGTEFGGNEEEDI